MKQIFMYQCEICKKIDSNPDKIVQCEAAHYNISIDEYHQWKRLTRAAVKAGREVGYTKCPETDQKFDHACRALADFESAHCLTEKSKPLDFVL